MNERIAINPAKWFPGWTTVASLLSLVLRVGSAQFSKRIFGALRISVMPGAIMRRGSTARVDPLAGPHGGLQRGAKRAMDIVLGALALMALSPLMAAVAVALHLESSGGIIVREQHSGPRGRLIGLFKFRSMRMENCDAAGARSMQPRLTPVGRVLRQLSLDELPQLVNVLCGEMSLVGPKSQPLRMRLGEQYRSDPAEQHPAWLLVKPGITGWAQINDSGGAVDTIEKAQRRTDLDLWYVEHWSIWLDVRIIAWTALNGFRPEKPN